MVALCLFLMLWNPVVGLSAAENPRLCPTLDEDKWYWHPLYGDFLPPFWGEGPFAFPDVSLTSCWNCGIWMEQALRPSRNQEKIQEALAYEKARCYLALGMAPEALQTFRQIVRQYPRGLFTGACMQNILKALFQDGNDEAVVGMYNGLDEELRDLISHEGLYLISQSLYHENKDTEAMGLLGKIPPSSDTYPHATYAKAQIAFRNGQEKQALAFLQALLDSPPEAKGPSMLREQALLTKARISFQEGRFQEAIDSFRRLSRSRFFLPEALMGMGWCYEALGEPSRAVSFFQTVGETSLADTRTWAKANFEIALLYSNAGSHEESLLILREVQDQLESFIETSQRQGEDREWLRGLARNLLSGDTTKPEARPPKQAKSRAGNPENEMVFLLEKKSYTSFRIKRLLAVHEALAVTRRRLNQVPDPSTALQTESPGVPFQYPPMEPSRTTLSPRLTSLLDASFALLDTEYRTDQAERFLGFYRQDAEGKSQERRLAFYRSLFQRILLPGNEGEDMYAVLEKLQSSVRNLPLPLEVRRKVLTKLLYAKGILREDDRTLLRWSAGMEEVTKASHEPLRMVMLRAWITYVRTLVDFRTWEDRSPAVFLKEGRPREQARSPSSAIETARKMLEDRLDESGERLVFILEQEIEQIRAQMLKTFEEIFAESQLYHAEALLHKQEALLKTFQSSQPKEEKK